MRSKKITYGIIGYPLRHTLSPAMHNTAFRELKANATYKAFSLKADQLDDFFVNLKEKSSPIFGLNVTIPYKEEVLKYMDTLTPFAQRVGAVNTIVISPERTLTGHNTDGPGFLAHLVELKINTKGKRVAILGAGGSARAILATLCLIPERPESIKIYNRTSSRLDDLLEDLKTRFDVSIIQPVTQVEDLNVEIADILINTTSVGLGKDDPCIVDEEALHSNLFVYDLIYNPAQTALLKAARRRGAKTANGAGMLFYQGVLALQHWADMVLDDEIKQKMRKSLQKELESA